MGDEEEVIPLTMNVAFLLDYDENSKLAKITNWDINWRPFWGEVTVYCSGCGIGKKANAQHAAEWLCSQCGKYQQCCARCKQQEFTHKHVQGRRFCSAPFIGIFLSPALFAVDHEDTPF